MTENPVLNDTPDRHSGQTVQRAEKILDHLYDALDGAADALEASNELDASVKKRIDEMRSMQVLLLKEGDKLNDLSRKLNGAAGGQALDLDGARAEIECRLACLRGAAGGSGVS